MEDRSGLCLETLEFLLLQQLDGDCPVGICEESGKQLENRRLSLPCVCCRAVLVRGAAFALLVIQSHCVGPVLTGTGLAVVTQMKLVLSALHWPGTEMN